MDRATSKSHWALVLAGGDGTRLQQLTREIAGAPIPKQYCRLLGGRSLLEATLARTRHFAPPLRTTVILNRDHLDIGRDQLRALPAGNLLVQPCNRDTGPGILFALLHLAHRHPCATVAVFPSDHFVGDDRAFIAHATRAARIVADLPDKVAVLGIRPDQPEPGYGYITPSQPLPTAAAAGRAFHVAAFLEKPTAELARGLLSQGGLWNSFVMVFRLDRMLDLLHGLMPAEFARMWALSDDPEGISDVYRDLPPWNFSTHVLARIPEHLVVLRVDNVRWSDWGTRESIERTLRALKKVPPWFRKPAPAAA